MTKETLEKVMKELKPRLHKIIGVSIEELNKDIAEKLQQSPLLDFNINTSLTLKEAKKKYRATYLRKLLQMNYGNISETAKQAGLDRRSIHRFIKEIGLNIDKIREELIKPYELKKEEIVNVIETELKQYEQVIHPSRLEEAYENVENLSEEIIDYLPEESPSLKEAEDLFEKAQIKAVIDEVKTLKECAKRLDIRYETLLRKMKK